MQSTNLDRLKEVSYDGGDLMMEMEPQQEGEFSSIIWRAIYRNP